MVALAVIDDVEDLVGMPGFDAILDGREVGGGVGERTVALADQEGGLGLFDEDDDGAFAFDGRASFLQVGDDGGELGVVEAFTELNVELHAQAVVYGLERGQAVGDEPLPEGAVFGVAGVELGGLDAGGVLDRFVAGFDPVLGEAVESCELGDGVGFDTAIRRGRSSSPRGSCRTASPSRPGGCRG